MPGGGKAGFWHYEDKELDALTQACVNGRVKDGADYYDKLFKATDLGLDGGRPRLRRRDDELLPRQQGALQRPHGLGHRRRPRQLLALLGRREARRPDGTRA